MKKSDIFWSTLIRRRGPHLIMIQNYDLWRSNRIAGIACPVRDPVTEDTGVIFRNGLAEVLVVQGPGELSGGIVWKGWDRVGDGIRRTVRYGMLVQPRAHGNDGPPAEIPFFIRKFEGYIQVLTGIHNGIDRFYADLRPGRVTVLITGSGDYQEYRYQTIDELHEADLIVTNLPIFAQKRDDCVNFCNSLTKNGIIRK
jgi:hypothetical protein